MRAAGSYRASRRNEVKECRGVWKSAITPTYRPVSAHGTSSIVRGTLYTAMRAPARTYKPNGKREVARRLEQMAA